MLFLKKFTNALNLIQLDWGLKKIIRAYCVRFTGEGDFAGPDPQFTFDTSPCCCFFTEIGSETSVQHPGMHFVVIIDPSTSWQHPSYGDVEEMVHSVFN